MSLHDLQENQSGRWTRQFEWRDVLAPIALVAIITLGLHYHQAQASESPVSAESSTSGTTSVVEGSERVLIDPADCRKLESGTYECATAENLAKWKEYLEKEIEHLKIEAGKPTAILSKVCRDKGFVDVDCPKILYAMAEQESYFGKVMVGDGGKSHGFFHIMDYHNVSKACSEDLACSAKWTLNRMVAKGFATNRDNAIRLHNGGLKNPVTLTYLQLVKQKMALWPS